MAFALGPRASSAGYKLAAFERTGSTNTEAIEHARRGERGPMWFVTSEQTVVDGKSKLASNVNVQDLCPDHHVDHVLEGLGRLGEQVVVARPRAERKPPMHVRIRQPRRPLTEKREGRRTLDDPGHERGGERDPSGADVDHDAFGAALDHHAAQVATAAQIHFVRARHQRPRHR